MVQPNENQGNAFDPAFIYKIEFDPAKKAPMANLMVEYTKMLEVEDNQASNGLRQMTRIMQTRKLFKSFKVFTPKNFYTQVTIKAKDMDMDDKQMWKDWPKCLEHAPRKVWDGLMTSTTFSNTKSGLKKATRQLLKHYAKDPCAKNMMIKNITKQFRKPPEQEVYDHYAQLDRLLDYTDMLPTETLVPIISDADRKDYLFETFLMKWKKEFINTKTTDYYQATVEDIVQFMKQKK